MAYKMKVHTEKKESRAVAASASASAGATRRDVDDEPAADDDGVPLFTSEVFGKLCMQDLFSDVTLIVGKGKERIPAHRIVLAASSPVFAVMLFPPSQFADQKIPDSFEVSLPSVDPTTFKMLLQCIYSDDLKIETANLHALIALGKRYQVDKIGVICAEFLSSDVSIENACELFEMAPALLGDAEFGMPFIREHTEDVFESEGFLKLSPTRLRDLLADDELGIEEFQLFQAVTKWAKAQLRAAGKRENPDEVKLHLKDILPSVRFPLMALEHIAGVIAPSGILAQEQLLELFKLVSLSDEKERAVVAARVGWSFKPRAGASTMGIEKLSNILTKKVLDKKHADAFCKFFQPVGARAGARPKAKFELIYRGSRDGFTAANFHSRCDGKGPTFTVIKIQGVPNICGGFTQDSWNSSSSWSGGRAWLFSLVNRHGRPVRLEPTPGSTNNVYHQVSYGPTWGSGHDLHVNNSMRTASNHSNPGIYRTITPGFEQVSVDNTLMGGVQTWTVEEIEVFAVRDYVY